MRDPFVFQNHDDCSRKSFGPSLGSRTGPELTLPMFVWHFMAASFLGYLGETLATLIKVQQLESRQGLLFGPFSQIYGFAAVIILFVLKPLDHKGTAFIFCGAAMLGGAYEIIACFIQELLFGSASWHYGRELLGIAGGRTALLIMAVWGVVGVSYLQRIFPVARRCYEHLPPRAAGALSYALLVFFLINMLLSALAVSRWTERMDGEPPGSGVEQFLDQHFGDEVLMGIYPNMVMMKRKQ